ncbi:MAG: ATP-binding cassette domain-containing protein [Bacteriovorax sp.]|nr:ATP-binding cassette domain-containing protein [Bacteriovorax sp.]
MTEPVAVLRADKISFSYNGEAPTLKDISFSLYSGESLGVLGPNGGGKSTLLKIIVGLLKADSGTIFFDEKSSSEFKKYPFEKFSYVPQNSELNTILPVKVSEYMDFAKSLYKDDNSLSEIDELLELVGILHKKDSLISKLSGGEKQRVLLARALITNPKLLLLDEPTKGLDSNGQDQLLAIIEKIKKRDKTAVMIVDHNINQIIRNCHKILCLNRTYHWHDHTDLLTKNILEDVYHCEFEHLLIHENDLDNNAKINEADHHLFCDHNHSSDKETHSLLRRKK